ncbi:hypothetical protein [Nodularia spumigena]|nr:hypothetical protein [Nodularia spumigena]MEA5556272.1 hypothetical protein [Nodularia spumigena CH309]
MPPVPPGVVPAPPGSHPVAPPRAQAAARTQRAPDRLKLIGVLRC